MAFSMGHDYKRITHKQTLEVIQALKIEYYSTSESSDEIPTLSPILPLEEIPCENSVHESFPPILSPAHIYEQEAEYLKSSKKIEEKRVTCTGSKSCLTLKLRRGPRKLRERKLKRPTMMKPEIFKSKRDRKEEDLRVSYMELEKNLKQLEGRLCSIVSQEKTKLEKLQKQPEMTTEKMAAMMGTNQNVEIPSASRCPPKNVDKIPTPEVSPPPSLCVSFLSTFKQNSEQQIAEPPNSIPEAGSLETGSSVDADTSDDNASLQNEPFGNSIQDDVLLLYDEDPDDFLDFE